MARRRIAAAARSLASRSMTKKEQQAAALAQEVYDETIHWRAEDGPIILAPLSVVARRLAPPALAEAGIPQTEDNLVNAAAILILAFVEAARALSEEDLLAFGQAR